MRLRIVFSSAVDMRAGRARLKQVFRGQIGSWAGCVRRADLLIATRSETGPGVGCSVHATLNDWADLSVHALGVDLESAVRSAARQFISQLRRRAAAHCSPSVGEP